MPQQEVDESHSRDLVSEAQVSAAQSHVNACEQRIHVAQADQARFKTLFQYAVITAPFAGVVTKRYANTGSLIQAGTASQAQAMRPGDPALAEQPAASGVARAGVGRPFGPPGRVGGCARCLRCDRTFPG